MAEYGATPRRRTERAMVLGAGKRLDQYDVGRRCQYPGCESRLSRYNPNSTCAPHGGWREDATGRQRRSRRSRRRALEH